ncbi:cobyrinate a,c-diamide synthase [Thalassotalea profundi]|uniref:Hydrogenobyrinate a,c-diamide synthase n=1 Tax=Thalassotalea profundi TaxID=2036687 RepID=A0ABQ3IPU3_9GAMM|nr:cobyrinate a,c-diamide synthase [Thalassotalea profundi]GHE89035.1 hydrogenobyrinate a,c-diamide synthase [Thalassotalea profundi]
MPFTDKPKNQTGTGVLCPALIISAPSSGSGKTTITAALARYHRNRGRKVTVFKVGPDFIDPMILRQASGELVYQLDLWLVGEQGCQELLYRAALTSDLILIEGVMGLFDGTPSSADIAEYFNIPVLAVIDASAMAQTFAAVTYGLAKHRPNLPFSGVIANRVNSQRHEELLVTSLASEFKFYGRIPKEAAITLPERHLGLVQAQELADIDQQLDHAADLIAETALTKLTAEVEFFPTINTSLATLSDTALADTRIAIIKDKAFSFIYAANIAFLKQAGAEIIYCSALTDVGLPEADVLYLPGGYPELYAQSLSENITFIQSIKNFAAANKPIVAECGGMLYLLDELTNLEDQSFKMAGLIPGSAVMQKKLAAIGSQSVELPIFNLDENESTIMRGHSFHYSSANIALTPISQTIHHPSERLGEFVYQHGNIIASYMHWYLPSNPELAVKLFNKNRRF